MERYVGRTMTLSVVSCDTTTGLDSSGGCKAIDGVQHWLGLQHRFCHAQILRIGDLDVRHIAAHQSHFLATQNEGLAGVGENSALLRSERLQRFAQFAHVETLRSLALVEHAAIRDRGDELAVEALNDGVSGGHDGIAGAVSEGCGDVVLDDAQRDEGAHRHRE